MRAALSRFWTRFEKDATVSADAGDTIKPPGPTVVSVAVAEVRV